MTNQRESLLNKIRALLAKTTENGATEAEALSALDKARAMMDAYEITEDDLQLTREEKAIIRQTKPNDKHGIRYELCDAVADFTDCKYWLHWKRSYPAGGYRAKIERNVVYAGLPSDVQFAEWLLDHLENFVRGELAEYLATDWRDASARRRRVNGFVYGCCARISERMRTLVRESKVKAQAVSNSRALVLVNIKKQAIADVMKADGINLTSSVRTSSRRIDNGAIGAGRAAGERANFGRPVGGGAQARLGK